MCTFVGRRRDVSYRSSARLWHRGRVVLSTYPRVRGWAVDLGASVCVRGVEMKKRCATWRDFTGEVLAYVGEERVIDVLRLVDIDPH